MRVLAATLALAAGALVPAATAGHAPKLSLLKRTPPVLRGTGFGAREAVRVVETAPAAFTRAVRTTRAGTFTLVLVGGDPCSRIAVVAVDSRGERVRLRIPPRLCAPAGTP
jgi:hypothetical protein